MLKPVAYSIGDCSKITTICRTSLYGAIKRGELRTCKVGRRTLVTVESLNAWLDLLVTKGVENASR
jgi:hypothetical protein